MAAVESPEKLGIKPFDEFEAANSLWPRGGRPQAIREAAANFRERFARPDNRVRAVRTVDLASAGYPTRFAFGGAAVGLNPFINILNRLVVVQFEDFDGELKTLAYEPTVSEGPAEAPFYGQLIEKIGDYMAYEVLANLYNTVEEALAKAGLVLADVDYISFDHLHVQDVRFVLGSTEVGRDGKGPIEPLFPRAKLLTQSKEWDTFKHLHPMQWAWYVEQGVDGVPEDNVVLLDGDVEVGKGCALVWTPGHTDGNHSLTINTPDGVWVSSENGVAADNWHPLLSKIPGVRKHAEFFGREVILNSNTLEDSLDQYDSMIKEKALADPNPRDPRFMNVFPSSEMPAWKRQWPVMPSFTYGGINYGEISKPPAAASANAVG